LNEKGQNDVMRVMRGNFCITKRMD